MYENWFDHAWHEMFGEFQTDIAWLGYDFNNYSKINAYIYIYISYSEHM